MSLSDLALHHLDVNYSTKRMKQTQEGLVTILKGKKSDMMRCFAKECKLVKTAIKDISKEATELPDEILFTINDSHGIAPDLVMNIATDLGWKKLVLRTGFNAEMAERHAAMAKAAAKAVSAKPLVDSIPELPATVALYYEDVSSQNFEASVLACLPLVGDDLPDGATHGIVLDRTCFYPEGGGQEGDYGNLTVILLHIPFLTPERLENW